MNGGQQRNLKCLNKTQKLSNIKFKTTELINQIKITFDDFLFRLFWHEDLTSNMAF